MKDEEEGKEKEEEVKDKKEKEEEEWEEECLSLDLNPLQQPVIRLLIYCS